MKTYRFVILIVILISVSALGCQYSFPTSGYIQGKQVEYSEHDGHPDKKKEDKDCIHQLKIGWRSCRAKWYVVNKDSRISDYE